MHYYIYKITNTVNNKIYIGKHKTSNLEDNYFGSGKILKRAIIKYGRENFIKDIIFQFTSEEEMNVKEKELVTEEFCTRKDTYNLCVGGQGGFSYINREKLHRKVYVNTEETKRKISETLKARNKAHPRYKRPKQIRAEDNGHTGMIWIYNPENNKRSKINPNITPIPDGWVYGFKHKEQKDLAGILKDKRQREVEQRYSQFLSSGLSLTKFAKSIGVSQPNLSMLWKRYNLR